MSESPAAPTDAPISANPPTAGRLLAATLIASVLAGVLAAWLSVVAPVIPPGTHSVQQQGGSVDLPIKEDRDLAESQNAAIQYGILGGSLGLALGLAGLLGGTGAGWKLRLLGPVLGLVNGLLLVGGLSLVLLPLVLARVFPEANDLPGAIAMHAGLLAMVGLAAGLAFGIGLGGDRRLGLRAILGGVIGGVVAAIGFDLLGGLLLPTSDTADPVQKTKEGIILFHSVAALTIGLGTVLSVLDARRGRRPVAVEPAAV